MNPGTQLGPYRVESLIGAGGMGEVYLGVDTRLDRQVAIKVLQGALAKDAALRERFEREARTISSLSHPNICTLFDLGRHEGSDYLVMEYLQGETLADRIARGPLPASQVVRIGLGIAHALEAAHRQGIVHRDLKPGNVMLTKGGVKLLDFGLAKLSAAHSNPHDTTIATNETAQKPLTEQGAILGTFQYMAPEQLEGRPADARTDIFALGTLVYEMATGRRAFQGSTRASLIASIIDREPPPMTEVQPFTPPALERVVRACLAKDPDDRIQTAHDVALQLKWLDESSTTHETVSARRKKQVLPWIVAGVLGLTAMVAGAMWWRERNKPEPAYTVPILPPRGHVMNSGALSPDGRSFAMSAINERTGEPTLWVHRLDDGTSRQLATSATGPFWSPDGQWIGYTQKPSRLMRVRVDGGPPETIARTDTQGPAAWAPDGTIVFCPSWGQALSRVPANGGEPAPLTTLDAARQESVHLAPHFLPDGRRFLYIVHTVAEKRNEIWVGSLDGEKPVRVTQADALIGYVEPFLLTARDGAGYAQRMDASSLELSGEPRRVLDNVVFLEAEALTSTSLSASGALVYAPYERVRHRLSLYDRDGSRVTTLWEDDELEDPAFSPDEKTVVVEKFDRTKGANDLWAVDLSRKLATKLTGGLANYSTPSVSSDGQFVTFHSDRIGMYDIYVQPIDGSPDRLLWKDSRDKFAGTFMPGGRYLLATRFDKKTYADIWVVPLDGSAPRPFVQSENRDELPHASPDGKWVAYLVGSMSGDEELYIRGFPEGRAYRVSTDGGGQPSWRADGRELVWTSKGRILSAALDLDGPTPQIAAPQELFRVQKLNGAPDVLKDGRIALLEPVAGQDEPRPVYFTTAWRAKVQ
jgi:serine/threonine protein kinase